MTLKDAIKISECVSVNYDGMTPEEIDEMDAALDIIFATARKAAKAEEHNDAISSTADMLFNQLYSGGFPKSGENTNE